MRVGIQPFTMSGVDEPLPSKLDRIALAGYEGVELGTDANTDGVHERLVAHDMDVTSIASGLDALDAEFDAHVAAAEDFDVPDVVVTWTDPEKFETRESVSEVADDLSARADRLAEHGLQLHYHNHDHEFTDLGERTGYELLVDETGGVRFEVDVGWAGVGGADTPALLRELGERVSLVHCKDMDFTRGAFTTFGEGDLDVEATVDAARDAGVEWLIFENDDPDDPVAEPAHASAVLDQYTDHLC